MEQIKKQKEGGYEKIGPTAWNVAYYRTFSDIKYAKEIFKELNGAMKTTDQDLLEYRESVKNSRHMPQFEARYKLINRLLEENKTHQVLELAAGLSGRGLAMTDADPSLQYIELDLPAMAGNKRQLLQNLFSDGVAEPRNNLHIEDGDVLEERTLLMAARYFKNEPISIINEGLLGYLNFDQKKTVAENIRSLLKKFGGAWITTDISLKKKTLVHKGGEEHRRRVLAMSGIDMEANSFEDEEAARKFFEALGFSIEEHRSMEVVDELTSPQEIGLSSDEVEDMLKDRIAFLMRLR